MKRLLIFSVFFLFVLASSKSKNISHEETSTISYKNLFVPKPEVDFKIIPFGAKQTRKNGWTRFRYEDGTTVMIPPSNIGERWKNMSRGERYLIELFIGKEAIEREINGEYITE